MTKAYPLQWPVGRPRKLAANRTRAAFGKNKKLGGRSHLTKEPLTLTEALDRLTHELELMTVPEFVLSTNLVLRRDGWPSSRQRKPEDPGVALYFDLAGDPHCLPCDTYDRIEDNVAAIAKHVEATRAQERYGVATIAEMFTGFTALPAPETQKHWSITLGLDGPLARLNKDIISGAYRTRSLEVHHSDGSDTDKERQQQDLNIARDNAIRSLPQ